MEGGLEMTDLEAYIISMKVKWIKTLLTADNANWKVIPRYFYNMFGENFLIFYINVDSIKSLNVSNLSLFYKNILDIWIKVNTNVENNPKTFL